MSVWSGHIQDHRFEVWNPAKSAVAIRSLVDATHTPTRGLVVGIAQIPDTLLMHQHDALEIYFILRGQARMQLGERTVHLEPEVWVTLPARIPHHTQNLTPEPVEVLYAFADDTLTNIEYVFDGHLAPPSEAGTAGRFETLPSDPPKHALDLRRLWLPAQKQLQIPGSPRPYFIYVTHGQGQMRTHDASHSLSEGTYMHISEGEAVEVFASEAGLQALWVGGRAPSRSPSL